MCPQDGAKGGPKRDQSEVHVWKWDSSERAFFAWAPSASLSMSEACTTTWTIHVTDPQESSGSSKYWYSSPTVVIQSSTEDLDRFGNSLSESTRNQL